MPRLPRIVIPDLPHHVTQRGNRKQQTFFSQEDYEAYKIFMGKACELFGVRIWSYCLMPNHVHLIAVPANKQALSKAIGYGHESYTRYLNFKMGWHGYLWQGRYSSFPMDEVHLLRAALYIELNPVAAKICSDPSNYKWSSIHAHMDSTNDGFVDPTPLLLRVPDWPGFINRGMGAEAIKILEKHQRTGRPPLVRQTSYKL